MKKTIFLFLLLCSMYMPAQNISQSALLQNAAKVYEATYNMDFEKILDHTHPSVFKMVDRETMMEMMENTFQNEEMRFRYVFPTVQFTSSDILKIGNDFNYAKLSYKSAMRMIFESKFTQNEAEGMIENLRIAMPNKKITFEKERNAFLIEGTDYLLAILDNTTNNQWKFINYSEEKKEVLSMILGEETYAKLKL